MHFRPTSTFESATPTWCPGCGNFGIWTTLKEVLVELGLQREQVVISFDIGCSGNGSNTIGTYAFHGLHGRALPLAEGIALAHHGLTTIVIAGDGGAYGEGGGHFLHGLRANSNVTYLVDDNQLYGLTKGQSSPTTDEGEKTSSAPYGVVDHPLSPVAIALAAGGSFVARGFAGNIPHLREILKAAIQHRGFSFVDILQPCVTFNHHNTYAWVHEKVQPLPQHFDRTNLQAAWTAAHPSDGTIPLGIFFQEERPCLQDRMPVLTKGPLVAQDSTHRDISPLLKRLQP
jgi:2-oxoglutarate ferredoxin oxidoreductase subunit beta